MIHNLRRRWHARFARAGSSGTPASSPPSPKTSSIQVRQRIVSLFSVSLLSAGVLTVGLTAGIVALGTIAATPAAAAVNDQGYYTSGSPGAVSGYCIDPGLGLPDGRPYDQAGGKYGNDVTKVLAWFATHYGPSGSNPTGGAGYNEGTADPRVGGLTSEPSAAAVSSALGRSIVQAEGGTPIHGVDSTFKNQLLTFAQEHQGPWELKIDLNYYGPYTAGNTYNGTLAINDKFGHAVPVSGINIELPAGATNVTIAYPNGRETDSTGHVAFTYTPTGAGTFGHSFITTDVAGRAPVWEDTARSSAFQRLMVPFRAESRARLDGFVNAPDQALGAFLVGKTGDGVSTAGLLPGATFWVTTSEADVNERTLVDVITTGPDGFAFSNVLLPVGSYYIIEVVAPPGYDLPTSFDPLLAPPIGTDAFQGRQLQPIFAGQVTNSLFADRPTPGTLTIAKVDGNDALFAGVFTAMPGVTFTVQRLSAAPASVGPTPGTPFNVVTDATGAVAVPGLYPGQYLITETSAPPGYYLADPQIQQVYPAANTTALFANFHPTVSTQISDQTAGVGETITDTITLTIPPLANLPQYTGDVEWTLHGPVPAHLDAAGLPSCVGASYTGAPTAASGVVQITTANWVGTAVTPGFVVRVKGCYTYTERLVGGGGTPSQPVSSAPGDVTETTVVTDHPNVRTEISSQDSDLGDVIHDTIIVSGAPLYVGSVNWTLFGPVAPLVSNDREQSCVGVDWAGAPTAATGSVIVNGAGHYDTVGYTIAARGCYTYIENLVGDAETTSPGPSAPGDVTETTLVRFAQPEVSTQISDQTAFVGDTITDAITVDGSEGYQGPVNWTLLGPVAPIQNGTDQPSCVDVNWVGAPTAATGFVTANGDGTYTTAGHVVAVQGCYTYYEQLVGDANTLPSVPGVPGVVSETTLALLHFPQVSTQISQQTANVGDTIHDAITVTGSGDYSGPVEWTLLGPVAPGEDAEGVPTCVGVDWAGAATAAEGSVTVNGDGTYITADYTVTVEGCFTYTEYLPGDENTAPAGPSTPGAVSETVIVFKYQPEVSTQISQQTANVGDVITDAIKVTGSHGYNGPVLWVLLGPVAPIEDADGNPTCVGVSWFGSAIADKGFVIVNGDGTYITDGYTVPAVGCYTYTERLVGDDQTAPAGPTLPGIVSETVLVSPFAPEVSTQISQQSANVGDVITDAIKVTGSGGYQGLVNWTLHGPINPTFNAAGALTCVGVSWTGAPIAMTGSVTVDGDGVYTTEGYTVTVAGCYTYTELLVGDDQTTPAGPSTPGQPSETVLVYPPNYTPPGLPTTGSDVGVIALGGLGLIAIGAAAAFATRRRKLIAE